VSEQALLNPGIMSTVLRPWNVYYCHPRVQDDVIIVAALTMMSCALLCQCVSWETREMQDQDDLASRRTHRPATKGGKT